MKVALPLFRGRISPRFDVCPEIWMIELNDGKVVNQEKWPIGTFSLHQRLDRLSSNGVNKVICGGIDSFSFNQLGNRGIEVICNVAGEAGEVLNLFRRGMLRPGFYCHEKRGKGFCGWRRGQRRRGNQVS